MIYAGALDRGYWIEDYAKVKNMEFIHIESMLKIDDQINLILGHAAADYTVFDVNQYIDEVDVIADRIIRICRANNSKAIILASGFDVHSEMIRGLWNAGLRNFILSSSVAAMRDEMEKSMNGYYEASERDIIQDAVKMQEKEKKDAPQVRMIGVAGACSRIGTTTHAVQIVKYLEMKGYRAAYLQMNRTDYIKNMREWFNVEESEEDLEIGRCRFQNVDHFYKSDKIDEVLKLEYDFYIYDYGTYFDPNFNRVSFLEKDFRIFIVGCDPIELPATYEIVRSIFYERVKYIFNFVAESEKDDIREIMQEKYADAFRAGYIPDKYILANSSIYDAVIPVTPVSINTVQQKKKGLFWRKRSINRGFKTANGSVYYLDTENKTICGGKLVCEMEYEKAIVVIGMNAKIMLKNGQTLKTSTVVGYL